MNTNTESIKCVAITTTGNNKGSACKNPAHQWVDVLHQGINAYHTEALPARYQGQGWLKTQIPVCNNHNKVLGRGNALKIQSLTHLPKEEEMNDHMNDAKCFNGMRDICYTKGCSEPGKKVRLDADEEIKCTHDRVYLCEHHHGLICSGGTLELICGELIEQEEDMNNCDTCGVPTPTVYGGDRDFCDEHKPEFPDECEDAETNKANAIKEMHGRPYEIIDLRMGSHIVQERCDHDNCAQSHHESGAEASNEMCCGQFGDDCPHYYAWTCLHHPDITKIPGAVKHNLPKLTKNDGRVKQWHSNRQQVNAHKEMLRRTGFTYVSSFPAQNGHGHWVYWTYDQSLVAQPHVPKVTFSGKRAGVLCGNCRKNGADNPYHATTDEVKACYTGK